MILGQVVYENANTTKILVIKILYIVVFLRYNIRKYTKRSINNVGIT